jgi:hypothetical protein
MGQTEYQTNIVDDTNLKDWQMMPYALIAERNGYRLVFAEPKTAWKYTPSTLAQKNVHGVTTQPIARMLHNFNRSITPENLIARIRADNTFKQLMRPSAPSQTASAIPQQSAGQSFTLPLPSFSCRQPLLPHLHPVHHYSP